jgi:hypothetical protein
VPADQTLDFQSKLKTAGVSCNLITITNGMHRIADWNTFDPVWQAKVTGWLNEILSSK